MMTENESDAPGASVAASGSVIEKPAGTLTDPSDRSAVPSLRTTNVRVMPAWPSTLVPKSTTAVCPSVRSLPPDTDTEISGAGAGGGAVTVPASAKLNGLFAPTFVEKLTLPVFAPIAVVGIPTVNVADCLPAIAAGSGE